MSISYKNILAMAFAACIVATDSYAITSLAKNDPDPVYTSLDPHTFLYTRTKLMLKGYDVVPDTSERAGLSFSPFGHNADLGGNYAGEHINLGDIDGRWNMLALTYGSLPAGHTALPSLLLTASQEIFTPDINQTPDYIDQCQEVGFFTIPMSYRKRGIRFEFDVMPFINMPLKDFGISVQTGVTEMSKVLTLTCTTDASVTQGFNNLTPSGEWTGNSGCSTALSDCNINQYLMYELPAIAEEIDLNINNFTKVSIEEVRINGYWRHAFPYNTNTEDDWPEFLFIPFAQVSGSFSPGAVTHADKAFSPVFGNNGHNAVGFNAGFNIDFFDTIEVGAEVGYTHFFARSCVNMRVPNSPYQSGIYPFSTNVRSQPGDNVNFAAKISAYHFIDRLSMYFQWMFIDHQKDSICLLTPDDNFFPEVLENRSAWQIQVANVGFNYDIAPFMGLGFLWQAPLNQKNVYRGSLVMLSLNASW